MADNYTIKFNNGSTSFEVQGPNETWVDAKVTELKDLMEKIPVLPVNNIPNPAPNPGNPKAPRKPSARGSSKPTNGADNQVSGKWDETVAQKITTYVEERQGGFDKGLTKQATVVATYIKDEMQIETVGAADLEFIYRKLGWPTVNHAAQLNNAMTRDKFFAKSEGGYELTHAGLVFGRDTSKAIAKDKK
jgi:hypothetical protein